jgi:KDO2-lipid IV(A) lauroyltransferase
LKYFFKILSKISIEKLYFLSSILNNTLYYIYPYRNKIINQNLQKIYPKKSIKEIKKLKKKFYKFLTDTIFETIKLLDLNIDDIKKRVTIKNSQLFLKNQKKKNIIIVSSHYSNWEWLFARITILTDKKIYAVYKPLKNIFFNNLILRIRSKFGGIMLNKSKAGKYIIQNKNDNKTYFFLSDQVPENLNNVYETLFMNNHTTFSTGVEKLSKKVNAIVLYAKMKKLNQGHYSIEFIELNNNITEKYVEYLEKSITEKPEFWLWSHNRWKR